MTIAPAPTVADLARVIAIQQEIVTAPLGLDELMTLVCERTLELLPGHGTAVELVEGDEMVYRAVAGRASEAMRGTRLNVATSLSGFVVLNNQTIRCDDTEADPRCDRALARRMNIRSMIVVPLVHEGRPVGVLKAFAALPYAYAEVETERLRQLAAVLSAVLGRAAEVSAKHDALRVASEREEAFRTLVFTAFEAVAVSKDGLITEANPRFLEMFGVEADDVRGRPLISLVAPRDLAMVKERVSSGYGGFYEFTGQRSDGTEFPVEGRGASLNGKDGVLRVSTLRDVTERKRVEAVWRESERRSQEAARLKSEFMANMSHEVRTPLNGIMGLTDLLATTTLDEDQREYARLIRGSADTLLKLVTDILDFSKIEANQFSLELLPLTVAEVVSEAAGPLATVARPKGLELTVNVECGLSKRIGDPTRLRQVLINLISNALKFTPAGRVDIRVVESGGDDVRFEITDTGIGIAASGIDRLFKPFSQVDASMSRRFGGSGLGLSISRQLVEMMGGRIGVDSEEGRGSTFWFEVPLPPATERPAAPPPRGAARAEEGLRVLIAEDNAINRLIAIRMMEKMGHRPVAANDGAAALDAFHREPFDLVLMDCQMPVIDGFEATRRLREIAGPSLPIVAMTANARPEDRDRCLASGMTDYIAKPIDLEGLTTVVNRATGRAPVG